MLSASEHCVYDVYLRVFDGVTVVVARGTAGHDEMRAIEARLDALTGASRAAAALAKMDAQGLRGTARPLEDICLAVCDCPCEEHPALGVPSVTSSQPPHLPR